MEGWIKIHRMLLEWEWYKDSNMVHLFIHFLLKANHEAKKWQGINIERGQLLTGRKALSQETGIKEQTIRTCLKRLKSTNEITIKPTNKYSIITICNYDSYQGAFKNTNQQTNQPLTNQQPTTNQQLTTNKNDKKDKNEKESLFDRENFFQILEIFYFKNFKNPVAVTRQFFNHYEKTGWNDKNGNPIKSIAAAAENWDNHLTEGMNCPVHLLVKWKVIHGILKANTPKYHLFLTVRPAKFENNNLVIRGKQKDIEQIENDNALLAVYKNALFTVFGKITVNYEIDTPNLIAAENESLVPEREAV